MRKTLGLMLLALFVAAAGTSCVRYVPYDESGRYAGSYDDGYDNDYGRYDDLDSAYFYDQLQPYGMWVSYRPYGYVWIPSNVGYNWRPYTRGHWAWTDYGWNWVSIERWGWIAFHYGRWGFDRRMGWFWVPDVVWGPAWVAWRWGDTHIGWAPLPPGSDFLPGRGFGRRQWDIPGQAWNFVRGRDFLDRTIDRWVLPVERNLTIIDRTRFDVNIDERDRRVINHGVDVDFVRRQTERTVERYMLKDATRPGLAREEGQDLVVAKPVVRRNEAAKPKQVLDETEAEREIVSETGRVYRRTPRRDDEVLREEHVTEKQLLKESQEAELKEIERKAEDEKTRVQNPVEKRKVEDQAKSRVSELKKRHDQEKAELEKRQKAEERKVEKPPIKRKTATEPDKKS